MTLRKIVGEKERWANYINLVSLFSAVRERDKILK
jgi:hypothetical protein